MTMGRPRQFPDAATVPICVRVHPNIRASIEAYRKETGYSAGQVVALAMIRLEKLDQVRGVLLWINAHLKKCPVCLGKTPEKHLPDCPLWKALI